MSVKGFFFFKKLTLRATSLEKLAGHVDFPHTYSIALLRFISNQYGFKTWQL